jgi:hypothetical protein
MKKIIQLSIISCIVMLLFTHCDQSSMMKDNIPPQIVKY